MGYAQFLFEICPAGKSSGGTSALLECIDKFLQEAYVV